MSDDDRQRVVRVAGARRAKLTPAPGTSTEPALDVDEDDATAAPADQGPNDQRMLREVPPHY